MIGLVFSKLSQAENIGYIIPMEEIELFLKDVSDGRYDGKPVFIDEVQTLENETLREKLKLEKKTTGVAIRSVTPQGAFPLLRGDVITRIGEHSVDNSGMVRLDRDRLFRFQYLIQRLVQDNKVPMTVVRDGREIKCDVPSVPSKTAGLFPIWAANTRHTSFTAPWSSPSSLTITFKPSRRVRAPDLRRLDNYERSLFREPDVHSIRRSSGVSGRATRDHRASDDHS